MRIRHTIKGEALALIDALILVDEEVEVVVRLLNRANLILVVDEISSSRER